MAEPWEFQKNGFFPLRFPQPSPLRFPERMKEAIMLRSQSITCYPPRALPRLRALGLYLRRPDVELAAAATIALALGFFAATQI